MTIQHALIDQIKDFIISIGLKAEEGEIPDSTFVPGIYILNGTIWFDRSKLTYPGDLLHEAGHLALMEPKKRPSATGDLEPGDDLKSDSLEIGAILWSYAALKHINLEPKVVFHDAGYRGSSEWYIENFESGNYIGLPLLQWIGLCKKSDDINNNLMGFPHMIEWLRN